MMHGAVGPIKGMWLLAGLLRGEIQCVCMCERTRRICAVQSLCSTYMCYLILRYSLVPVSALYAPLQFHRACARHTMISHATPLFCGWMSWRLVALAATGSAAMFGGLELTGHPLTIPLVHEVLPALARDRVCVGYARRQRRGELCGRYAPPLGRAARKAQRYSAGRPAGSGGGSGWRRRRR